MAQGLPTLPPSADSHDLTPPDPGTTLHGVVLRPPHVDWEGQRDTGARGRAAGRTGRTGPL